MRRSFFVSTELLCKLLLIDNTNSTDRIYNNYNIDLTDSTDHNYHIYNNYSIDHTNSIDRTDRIYNSYNKE